MGNDSTPAPTLEGFTLGDMKPFVSLGDMADIHRDEAHALLRADHGTDPVSPAGGEGSMSDPTLTDLFQVWVETEALTQFASGCPDIVMNRAVDYSLQSRNAMGQLPARNADELLLKIYPLLLEAYEASALDQPPLLLQWIGGDGGFKRLFEGVLEDLARISPPIAQAMSIPSQTVYRRKAAEQRAKQST